MIYLITLFVFIIILDYFDKNATHAYYRVGQNELSYQVTVIVDRMYSIILNTELELIKN